MISSYAYLLVFHGSRDSRTQAAALNLRNLLLAKYQSQNILTQQNYLADNYANFGAKSMTGRTSPRMNSGDSPLTFKQLPLIELAALELTDQPLNQSLSRFAKKAAQEGFRQIKVIPLFLAPGVHVQSDLPAEIALAAKELDKQVTFELSPYLGKYSEIVTLLANRFAELSAKTRILIAHGSKLLTAREYYQNLSQQLDAELGYWSMMPQFTQQIKAQIALGNKKIAILPYFLFPGRITEAIATEVNALQQQYPQVELILGQPLGASPALAELIFQQG